MFSVAQTVHNYSLSQKKKQKTFFALSGDLDSFGIQEQLDINSLSHTLSVLLSHRHCLPFSLTTHVVKRYVSNLFCHGEPSWITFVFI